jgi:hypothetical protein
MLNKIIAIKIPCISVRKIPEYATQGLQPVILQPKL